MQLSSPNKNRVRFVIEFTPSSIVAGNTGRIYIGRGFIPSATIGDPNQGDVLNSGSFIEESAAYVGDTMPFKGALWAIADAANQQITYDEEDASPSPTTATAA